MDIVKADRKVSAIITTHNRADILPRAIHSVLNQTYSNIEVIVVDDGSTDDTESVVKSLKERYPHINYLKNDLPMGACNARNKGVWFASGYFIAGLDDDDEWDNERIKALVNNECEQYSMIGSNDIYITPQSSEIIKRPKVINYEDILYKNSCGNQGLMRTDRLRQVNGFDENLPSAQDFDMWIRMIKEFGPAKVLQQPLQKIYVDQNIKRITSSDKKVRGYLQCYQKHKGMMSNEHKKYQLFHLYRVKSKRMSLSTFFKLYTSYGSKEICYYLYKHSKVRVVVKKLVSILNK